MTSPSPTTLTTRVVPTLVRPSYRARHVLERNWIASGAFWKVLLAGFFEPVFYLLAIGVGLGSLIGEVTLADGTQVAYAAFVAPGMLAASAMNAAVTESTFNVFFKFKYGRVYQSMLATPVGAGDIAVGEIGWSLFRGFVYSTAFLGVMAVMGLTESWWAIGALLGTTLIGLAFGAAGMAAVTFMRTWQDFDLITFVTLPLFLFSATFYPLEVYPPWLQTVASFSPLYHGAELVRGFTLGRFDPSMLTNALVLASMATVGAIIAVRRLGKLLLS